jgi:2-polyprenyl-3-methyl-5-hydroxy-6-metoxy-1,4-benzoquinol methylase
MSSYWDSKNGYDNSYSLMHHSNQNETITKDLLNILNYNHKVKTNFETQIEIEKINIVNNILNNSKKILEIGCGTGELINLFNNKYNCEYLGTDITDKCINYAIQNYKKENINYLTFNCLTEDIKNIGNFDISICSNCLEHFKNPYLVIEEMKKVSEYIMILVPFNQTPMTDGYDGEGGAGHVFKFIENSFEKYNVICEFKFFTNGWTCGEKPLQWFILIKK